jgi:hypothetical protein
LNGQPACGALNTVTGLWYASGFLQQGVNAVCNNDSDNVCNISLDPMNSNHVLGCSCPTTVPAKTLTCPTGYTPQINNNNCYRNSTPAVVTDLTCPTNYTADLANNRCVSVPSQNPSSLTCNSVYFSPNISTNKCVATT